MRNCRATPKFVEESPVSFSWKLSCSTQVSVRPEKNRYVAHIMLVPPFSQAHDTRRKVAEIALDDDE